MLASLERLQQFDAASDPDNSSSNAGSLSNSLNNSRSTNDLSGNDNSTNGGGGIQEADIIAHKSAKTVFYLKIFVLFVLVAAAAMVGAAVYLTTSNGEQESFERAFENNAVKVFDTFKFNVERKLGALDKFSIDFTSVAVATGATFPNVSLPDFAYAASSITSLSDAVSIMYLPLVTEETRPGWEAYSVANAEWLEAGEQHLQWIGRRALTTPNFDNGFSEQIYVIEEGQPVIDQHAPPFWPIWQNFPAIPGLVNYNLLWDERYHNDMNALINSSDAVIGKIWDITQENEKFEEFLDPWVRETGLNTDDPVSKILYPVFDSLRADKNLAGMAIALINLGTFFNNVLAPNVDGIIAVVSNECNQSFTYRITGATASLVGVGDEHDPNFNSMGQNRTFNDLFNEQDQEIRRYLGVNLEQHYCPYTLAVYPSDDFKDDYVTDDALYYTIGVVAIFGFTILLFLGYDYIVSKRQQLVMKRAVQSRAIVSSLFPAAVRDRLFRADDSARDKNVRRDLGKNKIKNFLSDVMPREQRPVEVKPIADLFPHTTVMFADIAGFTKWSSERDPTHVFTLLQTVYGSFDRIAKRRHVFKVETIGDCYVAVTGLPDPQEDHALRMAKFAHECKEKFKDVVEKLKLSLGEDTADLAMRFGLHSGPVTAGVLRGEKSRFQLFGNTVNTAAKMENSGQRDKIQISSETADLITAAGKGHWIFQRVDDVAERGGIQTFWVEPQTSAQEAKHNNAIPTRVVARAGPTDSSDRLVDWNVDLLKRLLKRIVAYRKDMGVKKETGIDFTDAAPKGTIVRDEMSYSIDLPTFDKDAAKTDPSSINLGKEVEEQLHKFVALIAGLYHDNPFHNFKHASNVCTNANKMMNSIIDQDIFIRTSDPLTQFAVVFSALIHDADHLGVPNMILMKERPRIAALYQNKSCAEQNSVDLAWNLLMDPEFSKLQETIFFTKAEFIRFRKIVVNIVMSTDIFDKELNGQREERWQKAFGKDVKDIDIHTEEMANLRATVAIEFAMQLADIMHTTQHFHSYCRWNERLFEEMYRAYESGRSKTNPAEGWYQGELWFFDNCVIPMAGRIKGAGVFGAQGEDCLRNALDNKKEWAIKGGELVEAALKKVQKSIEDEDDGDGRGTSNEQMVNIIDSKEPEPEEKKVSDADKHLIEWNVDLFKRLLRQILAHRMGKGTLTKDTIHTISHVMKEGSTVRDELSRILKFPFFDKEAAKLKVDPETIELSPTVEGQLRDYILFIASMYKDHAFHNFKHASNVATATNKFLQRIKDDTLEMQVFDPLTQFAIIFSSLVHDVDHPGVPNHLLVTEKDRLAVKYNNKSIAEQNATDVAWKALMDSQYKDLQDAIYGTVEDLARFRALIVNCILATDLFDQELIADRMIRWKQAFEEESKDESLSVEEHENLRATVVVEHVLMAADIGHTMQHWHSYKRWNERLYFEMYEGFQTGRLQKDPTATWYQDEIKFFDDVVIPMANRLRSSGVFGVAGDDAIRCAQSNRKDWVVNGGAIVEDLKKRYNDFKAGNIA